MKRSFLSRLGVAAAVSILAIVLAYQLKLDGVAHGGSGRMVGRLHPLLVHLPLGLLLLVPLLEILARWRPALKEAAGVVLGLGVVAALVALGAGMILARADGHEGELVSRHLWGGVAVVVGSALAWALRGTAKIAYTVALIATLGALGWAAHQGGSLTHGVDYLTEPLPLALKRMLRITETPAAETYAADTIFGRAVHPVLEKHCFACHGPEKQKGDYRMDAFVALLAGGKSGKHAIVPGQLSQSELVRRLTLDLDDEKVMPPKKKPRPAAAEVALIRWWIKQGASRDLPLSAATTAPAEVAALLAKSQVTAGEDGEAVYVARVGDYSALKTEIQRLEHELKIKIIPVSRRAGDGLILRPGPAVSTFGDAELAQLDKIAPFIVEAELAGTQISDTGLASLKPFTSLERLHLERTKLKGEGFSQLSALKRLSYLNLCNTEVSDATVKALAGSTSLKHLYVFGSQVTPAGATELREKLPQCFIGAVSDSTATAGASSGLPENSPDGTK